MTKKDYIKFAKMIEVILKRELKTVEENPGYKLKLTPVVSVSHIIEETIKIFESDNPAFDKDMYRRFINFDFYQTRYNELNKEDRKAVWNTFILFSLVGW